MANFPKHSPLPWKFVRGESVVCRRRQEVTEQMRKAIDETRAPSNGLWFDQQRHVVQVVPSEMADPKSFDNFNYSYQVYARLPPIQSEPRSLAEVTDEPPPIRYNVKRVAVDKPCDPDIWECAAHWSQRPWVLKEVEAKNLNNDCSQNNGNAASMAAEKDPRGDRPNYDWPLGKQTTNKPTEEFKKPRAPYGSASNSSCSASSCSSAQIIPCNRGRRDFRNCNNNHRHVVHKVLTMDSPPSPFKKIYHTRQDVFLEMSVMMLNKGNESRKLFPHHYSIASELQAHHYDLDVGAEQDAPDENGSKFDYTVDNICTNNNATVRGNEKPGLFYLHCYPDEDEARQNQPDGSRVCRPVKHYPSLPRDKVMKGEIIKNRDDSSLLPKLRCKVVPRCAASYDLNAARRDKEDPLLVCQEEKPDKVQPAYGTYKIIMGHPNRLAPTPDYYSNIKLPPDLEEYREFQKRCPNLRYGRYDRADPAYEMLLPANKDGSLLKGGATPFIYTKDPKRGKYQALFHVKNDATKELQWNLPSGMHK